MLWTPEEDTRLIAGRCEGRSIAALAVLLGRSSRSVAGRLRRLDLTAPFAVERVLVAHAKEAAKWEKERTDLRYGWALAAVRLREAEQEIERLLAQIAALTTP